MRIPEILFYSYNIYGIFKRKFIFSKLILEYVSEITAWKASNSKLRKARSIYTAIATKAIKQIPWVSTLIKCSQAPDLNNAIKGFPIPGGKLEVVGIGLHCKWPF